jgi:hypothetical protein
MTKKLTAATIAKTRRTKESSIKNQKMFSAGNISGSSTGCQSASVAQDSHNCARRLMIAGEPKDAIEVQAQEWRPRRKAF